jgi:hypothetical protein
MYIEVHCALDIGDSIAILRLLQMESPTTFWLNIPYVLPPGHSKQLGLPDWFVKVG